jgi:hypothetical protein
MAIVPVRPVVSSADQRTKSSGSGMVRNMKKENNADIWIAGAEQNHKQGSQEGRKKVTDRTSGMTPFLPADAEPGAGTYPGAPTWHRSHLGADTTWIFAIIPPSS